MNLFYISEWRHSGSHLSFSLEIQITMLIRYNILRTVDSIYHILY